MKILTVVGARPQFVKAAMVSKAIIGHNENGNSPVITEEIIHTGQHYDHDMSRIFFDEMGIPEPAVNLDVRSNLHGEMTGRMLAGIESEIIARKPDWVLVYGDTNSTLAAALAASKLHVKVAHVEAGLRSFNRKMPEEINRILTDHVSTLLFCPTSLAVENLKNEGIGKKETVIHVGDVMYDAALAFGEIAEKKSNILEKLSVRPKAYCLMTLHRAENTDSPERLSGILDAVKILAEETTVVFPVHPRTRRRIQELNMQGTISDSPNLKCTEPVSFLDMVRLEQEATVILTDSGGVQKEAYFHGVPCVTLRNETEWNETVKSGWNRIVGNAEPAEIIKVMKNSMPGRPIVEYGNGNASEYIVNELLIVNSGK